MAERNQITLEHANYVSPVMGEFIAPITLAGIINGNVDLTNEERRSVLAADAMTIGIDKKGILVAADIFMRNGIFRAGEVLGFDYEQSVSARDCVKTESAYEIPWIQFNLLREEDMAEIAIYRRVGMSSQQIADELGIWAEDVEEMTAVLQEYGIFGGNKVHEIRHVFIRDQIARSDSERERFGLSLFSNVEMGNKFDRSENSARRYRQENREMGRASTLSMEESRESWEKIREFIIANPDLSTRQTYDQLVGMEIAGVTKESVKYIRINLVNEEIIDRRGQASTKGRNRAQIAERGEEIVSILRRKFAIFINENRSVVLKDIHRDSPELSDLHLDTIVRHYRRMEARGEEVPPLKQNKKRVSV